MIGSGVLELADDRLTSLARYASTEAVPSIGP